MNTGGFFGRHSKGENCALDLGARSFERLAGFLRQRAGELFFSRCDVLRDGAQDPLPFEGRQLASSTEGADGGGYRLLSMLPRGLVHESKGRPIVRRTDFNRSAILDPLAL